MAKPQIFWREEELQECIAKKPLSLYFFKRFGWHFAFSLYAFAMMLYMAELYIPAVFSAILAYGVTAGATASIPATFVSLIVALLTGIMGAVHISALGLYGTPLAYKHMMAAITLGMLVHAVAYAAKNKRW